MLLKLFIIYYVASTKSEASIDERLEYELQNEETTKKKGNCVTRERVYFFASFHTEIHCLLLYNKHLDKCSGFLCLTEKTGCERTGPYNLQLTVVSKNKK